jgi:hypothetical protein
VNAVFPITAGKSAIRNHLPFQYLEPNMILPLETLVL